MKKIIFLLLFSVASYGQAIFDEGISVTSTKKNDATRVVVQDSISGDYHWQLNSSFMKLSDIAGKENQFNKQNSLATDGTGVKYPTVDAINTLDANLLHKTGGETKTGTLSLVTRRCISPHP